MGAEAHRDLGGGVVTVRRRVLEALVVALVFTASAVLVVRLMLKAIVAAVVS